MSNAIRRALYGKMAGDSTLTNQLGTPVAGHGQAIYHGYAPSRADFPIIVMQKQSGTPTYARGFAPTATASQGPVLEVEVWLVKAVHVPSDNEANSADTQAEAIASRVNFLLNNTALSLSGGATNYSLIRDSDVEYSEETDGRTYFHVGALWRVEYL